MNFFDDEEKMEDFYKLSKEEFLKSYSDLTEEEYNETLRITEIIKNEIDKVWLIEDNQLKCQNKIISKLDYFGKEVAVLKSKVNWNKQELLFKDEKQNCYWELGIAPIQFKKFLNDVIENKKGIVWNKMLENFTEKSIINFFKKSINKKQYFNKCELEFISRHCDTKMLIEAQKSRENILKSMEKEKKQESKNQDNKIKVRVKEKSKGVKKQWKLR